MSLRRNSIPGRSGHTFPCRYVERTISQLGEEALTLPLVARHLSGCPACRAQRRRVLRVDRALHDALLTETPSWYDGRWDDLCDRIPALREAGQETDRPSGRSRIRLIGAVLGFALFVFGAWQIDHPGSRPAQSEPMAAAAGVTITEAASGGVKASVVVDQEESGEGTVYVWVQPDPEPDRTTIVENFR
jgi:anti-sigma factor RsiW